MKAPIGIFDSGFGGLTVMKSIVEKLPQYDYIYLGDNARAPYGSRTFTEIYEFSWQAVQWFFQQGCQLVIMACNTASARALRSIQQKYLQHPADSRRVLGVIRPTAELVGNLTKTNVVGILGTEGTVASASYPIEIHRFASEVKVLQQACPLWVPLIENGSFEQAASKEIFKKDVQQLLAQDVRMDTILLACTHYPLVQPLLREWLPQGCNLISQGEIVANSLVAYLKRHQPLEELFSRGAAHRFFTTGAVENFNSHATMFFGKEILAEKVVL